MPIDLTAVIVDDYDEAIAFFVDALGFELVEDSPSTTNDGRPKRWVVVRPPGGATGLLLARADGEHQAGAVGTQWAGRVGLFLRVDDFDAAHRRMTNHGVEFVTSPRDEPYGRFAVFLDVAGNKWDLLGPPDREECRMADVTIPNFGELLAEYLGGIDPEAFPYLLSQLERTAAARYRMWADDLPEHRDGMLACAAREDEIAGRAEAMFPPTDEQRSQVEAMIGSVRDAYDAVFEGRPPVEQMTIQAGAERQGASAWAGLEGTAPDLADALRELSALEIENADHLNALLADLEG